MIKKILDVFFSSGKTTITEADVEDYLRGVEVVSNKRKEKSKRVLLLGFLVIVSVAIAVSIKLFLFSSPEPSAPLPFASSSTAVIKTPKPAKPKPPAALAPSADSAERSLSKASKQATIVADDFILSEKDFKNPFDFDEISPLLEDLQIRSKILDKKIDVYKKTAEYLEYFKKVNALKRELELKSPAPIANADAPSPQVGNKSSDDDKFTDSSAPKETFSEENINDASDMNSTATKEALTEDTENLLRELSDKSAKETKTHEIAEVAESSFNQVNEDLTDREQLSSVEKEKLRNLVDVAKDLSWTFRSISAIDKDHSCLYSQQNGEMQRFCSGDSFPIRNSTLTIRGIILNKDNEYRVVLTDNEIVYEVFVQTQ